MRRVKHIERPYVIRYVRGARSLFDSAQTLEKAMQRIDSRLSSAAGRGETASVYRNGVLLHNVNNLTTN